MVLVGSLCIVKKFDIDQSIKQKCMFLQNNFLLLYKNTSHIKGRKYSFLPASSLCQQIFVDLFKQQLIIKYYRMNKGAKENWFQSPLAKNGFWFFQQEKTDLFNFTKINLNDKTIFLTPSRTSQPIEIQKNRNTPHNNVSEINNSDNNKFDDVNLPDMFSNTKIQRHVISEKINFEDSSVIQEQDDYVTPQRRLSQDEQSYSRQKKYQPQTTAKKSNFHYFQQKKSRPKQKGLRMLSQKAYEIVLTMNGATYKQVANVLVEQLMREDNITIDGKDQQNIKRRVYDALNVLIALGVLKKDGRKIHGVKRNEKSQQVRQLECMRKQIWLKETELQQKQTTYQNAKIRTNIIKALIKRNKSKYEKGPKIEFPFIAIHVNVQDQKNIQLYGDTFQIVSCQKKIQPHGDLDAISYLKNSLESQMSESLQ